MPADAGITIHESRLLRTFGAPAIVASIARPIPVNSLMQAWLIRGCRPGLS